MDFKVDRGSFTDRKKEDRGDYEKFEYMVKAKKQAIINKAKHNQFYRKNRDLTFNQGVKRKNSVRSQAMRLSLNIKPSHKLKSNKKKHPQNTKIEKSASKFSNYCKSIESH